jgi:diketogulonate reductase-like aldo/keto reductase
VTILRRSADRSLQRLGADRIDLLQLHEPNPSIPIEETMGAMADLVDAGKVRFIGVSNFSLAQLQEAQKALSRHPIVSNQVRYNPIDRRIEKDLLGYCQSNGITIIAYSPLARGLGRIRDHDPNGVIESLVKETGKTAAQVILNWCLSKESVVAVPGSNSAGHILDNCGASGWRLSQEQFALLDRKILHRERTRFEMFVKRHTPGALRALAVRAIDYLPRSLRRRLI